MRCTAVAGDPQVTTISSVSLGEDHRWITAYPSRAPGSHAARPGPRSPVRPTCPSRHRRPGDPSPSAVHGPPPDGGSPRAAVRRVIHGSARNPVRSGRVPCQNVDHRERHVHAGVRGRSGSASTWRVPSPGRVVGDRVPGSVVRRPTVDRPGRVSERPPAAAMPSGRQATDPPDPDLSSLRPTESPIHPATELSSRRVTEPTIRAGLRRRPSAHACRPAATPHIRDRLTPLRPPHFVAESIHSPHRSPQNRPDSRRSTPRPITRRGADQAGTPEIRAL